MSGRYAIDACYFDVDETLIGADHLLVPELGEALAACRARGIRLGLATGRMLASARPYAEAIGADAPLILYNGARLQRLADRAVLFERTVPLAEAQLALRLTAARGLHVNLYLDDAIYIARESETARASAEKDGVVQRPVGDLGAFLRAPPTKLLVIGQTAELLALWRELDAAGLGAAIVHSEPTYLEILPPGVSKGAALAEAARHLGVPLARIAAFGDSNNDRELLAAAGLGVAVANALDAVKEVARHVTRAPRGLGVAEALRELILT